MPRCSIRCRTTPGSSWPGRVPIGRPSRAVKPMVDLDAAAGGERAHRGAAAEVGDDHPAAGDLGGELGEAARRCTRSSGRGSRSGGCPRRRGRAAGRSSRCARGGRGGRRCRSRRPAAGPGRSPRRRGWRRGCAAGAAAPAARARSAARGCRRRRAPGRSKSGPPCTTRWPTARRLDAAEAGEPARGAPRWRRGGRGARPASQRPVDEGRAVGVGGAGGAGGRRCRRSGRGPGAPARHRRRAPGT